MSKKAVIFTILASVFLAVLANVFVGRYLAAKISTWPLLNRWKILSPQAPIVINNHETVRVSDSGDVNQISQGIKSKISSVVLVSGTTDQITGEAVNLTADGSFVTVAQSFNTKSSGNYFVVLSDGRSAAITQRVSDPATALVFFKASLSNVPVPALASSDDLAVGDHVVFVQNSLQGQDIRAWQTTVSVTESDVADKILNSDFPSRGFLVADSPSLVNGQPAVDSDGNIVGLWNSGGIISSDVLKSANALYFNNNKQIVRPGFGFSYQFISQNESQLTGLQVGALIKSVSGPEASTAGLLDGDVITSVDSQVINDTNPLEPILEQAQPGQSLKFSIIRGKTPLTINLIVGQTK